jgi:hypothetical protein
MRHCILLFAALALGCGSSSATQGNADARSDAPGGGGDDATGSTPDAPGSPDSTGTGDGTRPPDSAGATDAQGVPDGSDAPTGGDSSSGPTDASPIDGPDVYSADGACTCQPYWCGCGACNPGYIACDINPPVCALGCMSSCPEFAQVTCTCDQGRCVRGGVDASTIGCVQDVDCPDGNCCAHAQGKGYCAPAGNTCCRVACP